MHTQRIGHAVSYVLPISSSSPNTSIEFAEYLRWLSSRAEIIVIDGSPANIFSANREMWGGVVRHLAPHPDLTTEMGKVGGVLTGVRVASHEMLIIADDDVRYDESSLQRVFAALSDADVVRPQNYFDFLPWHAAWDTSRMLLNRVFGGDWPGTLGVRKSALTATRGYDGSVMFENLELVRTVVAAGGVEALLSDCFVRRLPSTSSHFWSQRVRQAYDELARPWRLIPQLAILPVVVTLAVRERWLALAAIASVAVALAEVGRTRAGGRQFFPIVASAFTPLWLAERAVCSWAAVASRVILGGVMYRGKILRRAATPMQELRRRHGIARIASSRRIEHLEVDRLERMVV